jgi:dienelactone hydrolase
MKMNTAPRNGGKEVFLDSKPYGGSGRFKAYLLAGQGGPPTAVILLHGRNSNPDDGPVVGRLRRSLHQAGYTTLSLANPVPEPDEFPNYVADVQGKNALFPEAYARIRAGMAMLAGSGVVDVVLLGFSMGARMHAAFLAEGNAGSLPIRGLVALSNGTNGVGPLNSANSLPKIVVPVLDVYGAGDPLSADTAAARKAAYQAGQGKSFTQVKVGNSAPHAFDGSEPEMETAVLGWMKQTAPRAP